MKPFIGDHDNKNTIPLYIQLYRHLKTQITTGEMPAGERLPSLRSLAASSGLSVTTCGLAYDQLLTEGYIKSRQRSGYYVASLPGTAASPGGEQDAGRLDLSSSDLGSSQYLYDLTAFDFQKWKKCLSRVVNEHPELLLFESDVQGERALRFEISKYVYASRGVTCEPDQIVIGAGTQQLTAHLCRILRRLGVGYVCTEDPGYLPIQQIFKDSGFSIGRIPVHADGIAIDRLPVNVRSAVYVSPANQFPTGSVMPIGNRYRLLSWAAANDSLILEDDYDSELRYFGRPIPALQGLDTAGRVVYLGSFSSTLFPAIKISYMILPPALAAVFHEIKSDYTQTCSKHEQLALAFFMEDGYYYTNIRRLRSLYAQKLTATLEAFARYGGDLVTPRDTRSGISILLDVRSDRPAADLCAAAAALGLHVSPLRTGNGAAPAGSAPAGSAPAGSVPISSIASPDPVGPAPVSSPTSPDPVTPTKPATQNERHLIFYYNQIPLEAIDSSIRDMVGSWKNL